MDLTWVILDPIGVNWINSFRDIVILRFRRFALEMNSFGSDLLVQNLAGSRVTCK